MVRCVWGNLDDVSGGGFSATAFAEAAVQAAIVGDPIRIEARAVAPALFRALSQCNRAAIFLLAVWAKAGVRSGIE